MSPMDSREIEGEPQTRIAQRARIDTNKKVFERHTLLRQICAILLDKTVRAIVTFRKDSADKPPQRRSGSAKTRLSSVFNTLP